MFHGWNMTSRAKSRLPEKDHGRLEICEVTIIPATQYVYLCIKDD